jgi:DNA-3-methyladenine glycosylase
MKLPRDFYDRPTLDVARDLIGKVLVHSRRGVRTSGVIVEVEAYIGESDPACHAAPGRTKRNEPLYGPPGFAYVYLNYGIHALVNAVTESHGSAAAVLIRALAPLDGIVTMRRRRSRPVKGRRGQRAASIEDHDLCRGPGNLTMAMGITLRENELDLRRDQRRDGASVAGVPRRTSFGVWTPSTSLIIPPVVTILSAAVLVGHAPTSDSTSVQS